MPSPRIHKISLPRILDRYPKAVSVHKKEHQQELYRSNAIKRYPTVLWNMDEITTVNIATYRDVRLVEINPRTGRSTIGNTVRLEFVLLLFLFSIARVEWGICRTNPVEPARKPKVSSGRDRRLVFSEERCLFRYFREKDLMLYATLHFALKTTIWQGEILALRWEHIDLHHGVVHLPKTKNGHSWDVPPSRHARNFLQVMPVNLHGDVFDYTVSGFKNARRTATQRLRIEDLYFRDLRHGAISRFLKLGSLNVMEIAVISGHRSMSMLKRYTHLRAWQLTSKFDTHRRQTQKVAAWFVPYPAHIMTINEENEQKAHRTEIGDFDNLHVIATTKEEAIHRVSEVLLRTLAIAIQKGERVPSPGTLPANDPDYITTCPLNPGSTPL